MSEITKAIEARQTQITQLQGDIETLRRAAMILGRKGTAAKAASRKATRQPKAKTTPKPKTKSKQKRLTWSEADKKAISKRMKAYWAKRRAQKG